MKHLIMGTAGHVDHGKTALIKALTGIDCDTHKEEKERGITIHLGFAHAVLKDGSKIGIIDVPGHKDFIHTMLGGASGIDFVLLVIAADSGVMPQTKEHLRIMEILGVKQGIVALTKTDLVDEGLLDLCKADIEALISRSFLRSAPIIPVSSKTGEGLPALREAIQRVSQKVEDRSTEGLFRMYIDRIFTVTGFGTVVTGTVVSGKLAVESKAYLLPGKPRELRIRRMERHGGEVSEVRAGDRASLNLVGIEKSEVERGMLIADRVMTETAIFDADLTLYDEKSELGIWSQVIFHTGTYENQARVHLIDRNELKSGQTGIVQIHLASPCVLLYGDKFVIRNSSSDVTLGGGKVVDTAPLHHRRRPEKLVREISKIAAGDIQELIAAQVAKLRVPVAVEDMATQLNVSKEHLLEKMAHGRSDSVVVLSSNKSSYFVDKKCYREMEIGAVKACQELLKKNPLSERGANLNEIRGALKIEKTPAADEVLMRVLEKLVSEKKLRESNKTWFPIEATGKPNEASERNAAVVEAYLKGCEMRTPLMNDIRAVAAQAGIKDAELKQVLHYLTVSGKIYRIEDNYLHHTVVDSCRSKLIERLKSKQEGVSVSEFRDLVGGNRKICLLLLTRFDGEGLTKRKDDLRYLR
jgi:selenocysteine-specific elongation factor